MRDARFELVVAPGAAVGLGGPGARDRPHLVVVTVGTHLDATLHGQRPPGLPAGGGTTPDHDDQSRRSEQSELVAVQSPHLVVIKCHAAYPAVDGESAGLRLDLLGGEYSADRSQ
jgi:hypothetical protein